MNNKNYSILVSSGLIVGMIGAWREISMILNVEQNWAKLLSPVGMLAISAHVLLFLFGLSLLILGLWRVEALNRVALRPGIVHQAGWIMLVAFLLITTYNYLYSAWQTVLSSPWAQFMFAMSFAQIALFLAAPGRRQQFGWSELALTLCMFLYPRIVQETRILAPGAFVYRTVTTICFAVVVTFVLALYSTYSERISSVLISWREKMGMARLIFAALLCFTPVFHRYLVSLETYIVYDDIRFAILLAAIWAVAYLGLKETTRLVTRDTLGVSLGVLIFTSLLARYSLIVIDYPFSLSWSEGNRFYDYSLVFGQSLYNYAGKIINPYESPGRYALWGVLFLWEGLPIWAHRLWNVILLTLPPLFFSFLITRKLAPVSLRYGVLLWITLFFGVLAPLHPPFMIVSILVVFFAFDSSLVKRGILLVIASYYASLSRWTWILVPAVLGALIDLILYYPARRGKWIHRVIPTVILVFFAVLPGIMQSAGWYLSLYKGENLTSSQPLLWYRLLPNDTLGLGVLFFAIYATGPLIALLAWWILSRRWELDWVQKLAITGTLLAFFIVGLVISTKIGGGGDLHNLDMYLVTLMVVSTLGLTLQMQRSQTVSAWPSWAMGLAIILIFIPAYGFTPLSPRSTNGVSLELPKPADIDRVLSTVRIEADRVSRMGEVLFMDQRQLLTFGYVSYIPFVPEYEKKYMMDQAMGNNAVYFKPYYKDLARKRFALIVTEPLRTQLKEDMGGPFSEENDAWVTWVSNPTLCFYEPTYTSKETNIQLLVPREKPVGCEQYLTDGE